MIPLPQAVLDLPFTVRRKELADALRVPVWRLKRYLKGQRGWTIPRNNYLAAARQYLADQAKGQTCPHCGGTGKLKTGRPRNEEPA